MAVCRVFVIWTSPLLLASLRALLNHAQVEWLGDSSSQDNFSQRLEELEPDTIFLEIDPPLMETSGEQAEIAFQIMGTNRQSLRLIQVSLDRNDIQVYRVDHETIHHKEDLLKLLLKE
jgi:AmiR/NasT family two-component response regulator